MPAFRSAMLRLAALALVPLLAGCQSAALAKSPDYKAGYSDGCASAGGANMRADSLVRDDAAYRSNKAYHQGWGNGLSACRGEPPGGAIGMPARGPIPDPGTRPF